MKNIRRYLANTFIQGVWRGPNQAAIYLEEINDGVQARRVIKNWMTIYNTEPPHSALDRLKSGDADWANMEGQKAA